LTYYRNTFKILNQFSFQASGSSTINPGMNKNIMIIINIIHIQLPPKRDLPVSLGILAPPFELDKC